MAKNLRSDITGLRALAVVAVTLYHVTHVLMPEITWFKGGFLGVDIFFVISGYLMTMIIMRGLDKGNFSLWDFYKRRAKRICPALWLTVAVFVILGLLVVGTSDLMRMCYEGLYALLFVSNIYFSQKTDYFANSALDQVFLHTWSLSVEWQFYIFYPVVLMLIRRVAADQSYIARFILVLTIISFIFGCYYTVLAPQSSYYLLPARAFELLMGALAYFYSLANLQRRAYLYLQRWSLHEPYAALAAQLFAQPQSAGAGAVSGADAQQPVDKRKRKHSSNDDWVLMTGRPRAIFVTLSRLCLRLKAGPLEALGLVLLLVSLFIVDNSAGWPTYSACLPLIGTYLCIAANHQRSYLRFWPFQKLGLWSYAIYLVHWPILVFATKLGFLGWSLEMLLPIVICGVLLHYGVERRRNYGYLFVGVYALSCAAVGYVLYTKASFRFDGEVTRYAQYGGHTVPFEGTINSIGDLKRKPDFVLIGDSFARHYTLDLIDRGLHVVTVFRDGCYSFAQHVNVRPEGVVDGKCSDRYQAAVRAVQMHPELPIVVAQDWPRYRNRLLNRYTGERVSEEDFAKAVEMDLMALARDFAPARVYVLATPRQTVYDIGSTCMYLQALDNPLTRLLSKYFTCRKSMDLPEVPFNKQLEQMIAAMPQPIGAGVVANGTRPADHAVMSYLDPNDAICTDGKCEVLVGKYIPVFQDGLHYSWAGSIKVVSYLLFSIGVEQGRVRTEFEDENLNLENGQPLYAPDAQPQLQ